MSDNDGKIYVDASQPATLHNGSNAISCPTLQEAVLAWYRLPDDERERATIVATDGQRYTAQEIVRLYYRRRVAGGALLNASPLNQSTLNQLPSYIDVNLGSVAEKPVAAADLGSVSESANVELDLDPLKQQVTVTPNVNRAAAPIEITTRVVTDTGGPVEVSGPSQNQPPQGIGIAGSVRAGAQGRATLSVSFPDKEAVTGWLKEQSDDTAVVFAARAALRVLPTITFSRWPRSGRTTTREIILRVFRAVSTAWAVAAFPSHRSVLNGAARAALRGLGDVSAPSPLRAAVYASATASGEPGANSRAYTVIGYALDAAGSRGREAFQSLLDALATDASLLSDRFSAVTLANSRLWPSYSPPDWVSDAWTELKLQLLSADEHWEVWTKWYEERLFGVTADQDTEIARVTIENEIWDQEEDVVNAHIKELLEEREIFRDAVSDELENPPDADAIPPQVSAASQFALDREGRIDLVPDAPLPNDMQRELYEDVRYKALAMSELGHNQLAGMSEPISRFLVVAPERIEDVSITRLWSRGNTLRRRLKAHDTAATSADPTDPAILSTSVAELLRDLVDTYNVFIVGDPTGRELDQVRLGPQERNEASAVINFAVTITEAVHESEGLATADAVETLADQVEAARTAPSGIDGDQAVELSRKTTGNFVIELLRAAYFRVRAEAGFALKEFRAGVYRGFGTATAKVAGLAGLAFISFVATNAQVLKVFVEQALHNPALLKIIDFISTFGGVH
jgi:hypothetical protein